MLLRAGAASRPPDFEAEMPGRSHRFGRHDRLMIDGATYRVARKKRDVHLLQLVSDGFIEDYHVTKSDEEISDLLRTGRLRHDAGYFSRVLATLRLRHDDSDLSDLSDAELRTIAWKKEWCVRFNRRRTNLEAAWRPTASLADMRIFIDIEKDAMDRWYLDAFGERRKPGRKRKGEIRKPFDYPGASTLRDWLLRFHECNERIDAFKPGYRRSGNRNQIDPRAVPIIERCVKRYASSKQPLMGDIYEDVEAELDELNGSLPERARVYVSSKAVRRRIHEIDPFIRDAGRLGVDRALRKYTPVGRGLRIEGPMQRVEMDDWESDLQSLIVSSRQWRTMSAATRAKVPRGRCVFTIAIDVATHCIVGFNMTVYAPSTATARSGLRSVVVDKTALARWAGAASDWPMHGRPEFVATDGGPAFSGEFESALRLCLTHRTLPEQDPRMRGTIESYFRRFKRICRYFSGQTFANVVELGDYPSERMASLTFEGLYRSAIRWIVDVYHHKPHGGLDGGTPYGAWRRLTQKYPLALPPSDQQVKAAFGLREKRTIDKNGIDYLGLRYHSDVLGALHRLVGNHPVTIVVDENDLGSILVRVPEKAAERLGPGIIDYLTVPSVQSIPDGTTLGNVLEGIAEVREIVRQEQAEGRAIRLAAHRDLMDFGEKARSEAGVEEFTITQRQLSIMTGAIEHRGRAAFTEVAYGTDPLPTEGAEIGEVVAQSPRRRARKPPAAPPSSAAPAPPSSDAGSRRPFDGGMNLDGDDE